jgi:hypothetical protein
MLAVLGRIFSFADWQRHHPVESPPGDMLDASFDALIRRISELEARIDQFLRADGKIKQESLALSPSLAITPKSVAGNPKIGVEVGSSSDSSAEVWAYASKDWAEHMPGTIPDNSVTVMDVTGDHWSARWWAHYAARVAQARTLVSGTSTRYLFFSHAGQATFFGFDYYGVPLDIDWENHDVLVFVDGRLKKPEFDYGTSMSNTLELNQSLPVGVSVEILSTVPFDIDPTWQLKVDTWVFDGMATTFPLLDAASGNPVVPEHDFDVQISLDGVWLAAGLDYTVEHDDVTFTEAPRADSAVFGQARGGITVTP